MSGKSLDPDDYSVEAEQHIRCITELPPKRSGNTTSGSPTGRTVRRLGKNQAVYIVTGTKCVAAGEVENTKAQMVKMGFEVSAVRK